MLEVVYYLLILATSVPAGLLLAWLCDDEIAVFRRYIVMTIYAAAILAVLLSVLYFNLLMILSLVYSILVLLVVVIRSYRLRKKR